MPLFIFRLPFETFRTIRKVDYLVSILPPLSVLCQAPSTLPTRKQQKALNPPAGGGLFCCFEFNLRFEPVLLTGRAS